MKTARTVLVLEFLAALAFGLCFNASLMRDADTWWLLGLGRWINDHHCLPTRDPFSYTMALQCGREYVPHQWLSALIFYWTYHSGAIIALLMLTVGVLFGAFVVVPLRSLQKTTPAWFSTPLVILGVLASKFHFLARPEIFSHLCQAVLLLVLTNHRLRSNKFDRRFVVTVLCIFALWCNFHSGFIFGAILLVSYAGATLLIGIAKKKIDSIDVSAIAAVCMLPLALMANPFGIRLLAYLKNQLWFDPFMNTIGEMIPISLSNPTFFPFFAIISIFVLFLLITWRKELKSNQDCSQLFVSLCLTFPVIAIAFLHRRLILVAVLALLFEFAFLWSKWRRIDLTRAAFDLRQVLIHLASILICMTGVPIMFAWYGHDNKWDVHALSAVDKGIDFLKRNAGERRIFNDYVVGDRLIWLSPGHPLVFLDTRYDMYGKEVVDDYDTISLGQEGWQKALDKYDIEVVIYFRQARIADLLAKSSSWKQVYSDPRTVIFERSLTKVKSE